MIVNGIDVAAIAARKLLVTVTTGAWRATRKHRGETFEVNSKHGTGTRAKVTVEQCKHEALLTIRKLHAEAYSINRRMTFPTIQDGIRLLSAATEMEHAAEMAKIGSAIDYNLNILAADYYDEMERQRHALNGLFDSRAWPSTVTELRNEFVFTTRYLSAPTDGAWGEWLAESAKAADDEIKSQLRDALKRVAERCANDGRLHETVFSNLEALLKMVPDFDFAGKYGAVIREALPLASVKADVLRDNDDERSKVAAKANRILGILGGIK